MYKMFHYFKMLHLVNTFTFIVLFYTCLIFSQLALIDYIIKAHMQNKEHPLKEVGEVCFHIAGQLTADVVVSSPNAL